MEKNLKVRIGEAQLKNPITVASGTFGDGLLMNRIYDVSCLGGIFTKGTTLEPREGNAPQRMAETPSGMLNAVGLQNKGLDYYITQTYPEVIKLGTEIIPNVNGSTIDDYIAVASAMDRLEGIRSMELNISCPNVKNGGMAFGVSEKGIAEIVSEIRKVYSHTLIVKLSPNVTDIARMACIAEQHGADAVSLVNTFLGMAIDAHKRKPILSTVTGGLSGPAIKPIALRMVWQVARAVQIPVIGIGGITNGIDAIEFMLAGATAVQVGTYNFVDPYAPQKMIGEIEIYMERYGIKDIVEVIGALEV
ncbi:MAG: dihydroorotate dehydrogenase [Bacteroidales bacterium]|uniref:dihydroorotate dehydrogenase n=1 Tax=Porphyromonas sp. TaxID=1924944 RepID=UPI002971D6B6|nr:dihydroorotate dehydrogenase [Porphyromonas sp.]MDD7438030.1 dihydroorotate dehydrogenase [Bacteroidales bacterium]MDY3067812.1 dihydroorotate dehydrogenase [Porphyromonas sp.]